MSAPKHRRIQIVPVTHGWTRWAKHRSDTRGPAAADGMEEYQRKWVAAMQLREIENHRRRMAVCN